MRRVRVYPFVLGHRRSVHRLRWSFWWLDESSFGVSLRWGNDGASDPVWEIGVVVDYRFGDWTGPLTAPPAAQNM